jgi:hypothetical protein
MGLAATILVGLSAVLTLAKPTWGFCAFIATAIIRPNEQFDGVMIPTGPLMVVALGASYLIHFSRALPRVEGPRSKATLFFLGMMGLLLIHLLIGRRELLVDWMINELGQSVLILLFLTRFMSEPPLLRMYFTSVMLSSSVVAAIPVVVHFFFKGAPVPARSHRRGDPPTYGPLWEMYHGAEGRLMGKAKGMWGNSNDLGMLANWAIPCALYYLRRKGSRLVKILALGLLAMLAGVIMLTGSRGGQLNLAITFWMVFVGGKRKVLGVVLLLIALVGVMVVLPKLQPTRKTAGDSAAERTALIGAGVGMFKSSPLWGVGYSHFEDNSFRHLSAHNVYVQCVAETGLIGMGLFIPLIFFLRRETSRAVKHFEATDDVDAGHLARSIGALQIAFTVFILFSNQFMRFTFAIVQAAGIALYTAMLRDKTRRAAATAQAPPPTDQPVEPIAAPRDQKRSPGLPARERRLALPPASEPEPTPQQPPPRYVFDPRQPGVGIRPAGEADADDDVDEEPGRPPRPRR